MRRDHRPGRFNDGRSAASRQVTVAETEDGLEIRGEDGFLVAVWRLADLRAGGEHPGNGGVRLCCVAEPDARLTLDDTVFARRLLIRPAAGRRSRLLSRSVAGGFAVAALLLLGYFAQLPNLSRWAAGLVPVEMERDWGRYMAAGLERQAGRCRSPAGDAALAALAERLAGGIPAERRPVTVRVADEMVVNAIALPGAEIIIFRGLIETVAEPDELAGVLAHELAHVAERHPVAALIRGMGVSVAAVLITGDASGLVASAVGGLMASAYTREDEASADRAAVALLRRAGIGTAGLATFFRRLERKEGGGGMLPAWMSTHPESGARAAAIEAAIKAGADRQPLPPALRDEQWQAIKGMCGVAA